MHQNEDTIGIYQQKVEEILDKKIPCYMKYNDQNPERYFWYRSKKNISSKAEDILHLLQV